MDDVAAACGVTKLIVYRHFGSKEELYREILQQVFEDLGVELRAELAMPTHSGLGPRTLLTVARDDPAAFTLLVAPCGTRAAVRGLRRRAALGGGVGRAPAQRARHRRRAARRLALRSPLRLARRDDAHLAAARRPGPRRRVRGADVGGVPCAPHDPDPAHGARSDAMARLARRASASAGRGAPVSTCAPGSAPHACSCVRPTWPGRAPRPPAQ